MSTATPLSTVPFGFLDARHTLQANDVTRVHKNGFGIPHQHPINHLPKNGFEISHPYSVDQVALSKPEKAKFYQFPQCSTEVWRAFQSILRHDKEDTAFWWHATGPILALMMEKAGYSIEGQAAGLLFHHKWILPALGPRPTIYGEPVRKRDYMYDDRSPLEMSWSWDDPIAKPNSKPKIRYSATGHEPDAEMETWPVRAGPLFVNKLRPSFPGTDWTVVERLQAAWDKDAAGIESVAGTTTLSTKTDFLLGFELDEMNVNMKGYLRPPKTLTRRDGSLNAIASAVRSLETDGRTYPALDILSKFFKSDPTGKTLTVIDEPALAVDCVDAQYSRLKLYCWSRETSFEYVMKVLTLGEENSPLTPLLLAELFPLWKSVFGCPDDFSVTDTLTELPGEPPGVLYNFEFRPGSRSISPKLYIPAKHYGVSDGCVAYGLTNYLRHRGRGKYVGAYLDLMQSMSQYKSLGSTRGMQTYIQVGFTKGPSLSLTSYISPQIYHKGHWVEEN